MTVTTSTIARSGSAVRAWRGPFGHADHAVGASAYLRDTCVGAGANDHERAPGTQPHATALKIDTDLRSPVRLRCGIRRYDELQRGGCGDALWGVKGMSRPWRFAVATAQVLFAVVFMAGMYAYMLGLAPSLPQLSVPQFAANVATDARQREDRVLQPPAPNEPPAVQTPAPAPPPPPAARTTVTVPAPVRPPTAEPQPPSAVVGPIASAPSVEAAEIQPVASAKSGHEHRLGSSARSPSAGEHGPPVFARAARPALPSRRA